jgi:hypothetical protein
LSVYFLTEWRKSRFLIKVLCSKHPGLFSAESDRRGITPNNLLDALIPDELILLLEVEDTAMQLSDIQDMQPDNAIQQTAERLLVQMQTRSLKLK